MVAAAVDRSAAVIPALRRRGSPCTGQCLLRKLRILSPMWLAPWPAPVARGRAGRAGPPAAPVRPLRRSAAFLILCPKFMVNSSVQIAAIQSVTVDGPVVPDSTRVCGPRLRRSSAGLDQRTETPDASRASAVICAQSPRSTALRGVSQLPPTHETLGGFRYSGAVARLMLPAGRGFPPRTPPAAGHDSLRVHLRGVFEDVKRIQASSADLFSDGTASQPVRRSIARLS